jgi:hypothetical protein
LSASSLQIAIYLVRALLALATKVTSHACGTERIHQLSLPYTKEELKRVAGEENAQAHRHGAFIEPSRRNQWQPPANEQAAEAAETSQICCHGLRLAAAGVKW